MVEPSARFEEIRIPLPEPVHGLDSVSAVIGIPRWWPTGARVSVVVAHGAGRDMNDPVIEHVMRELTERRYLTLRFNFPFAEAKKRRPDTVQVLRRTLRAAVGVLARDPTAAPAHLFLGGKGLGGTVAADLATSRLRVDGLFFLGYPLHPAGKPEQAQADQLYRLIAPMHFVQGCPLCLPTLDAIRTYRARPAFSRKGGNTFGKGLGAHLKKRLRSEVFKERLDVVHTLIARWVDARVKMLRLTDAERAKVARMMAEGRKRGMDSLAQARRAGTAGAFKNSKRCAICDASNDPFK